MCVKPSSPASLVIDAAVSSQPTTPQEQLNKVFDDLTEAGLRIYVIAENKLRIVGFTAAITSSSA